MSPTTRLLWDQNRPYETGLDRGVFYPENSPGESWNGLIDISESSARGEHKTRYADGVKQPYLHRVEEFTGAIAAYSYPPSFYENVLLQRRARIFGMCYRTQAEDNYKLHLVYNVLLSDAARVYQQRDVTQMRWNFTTKSVEVPLARRTSHLVIDTTIAYTWAVQALEDVLYGTESTNPRLPLPEEVFQIFEDNSILQVTDHGDGTFTVDGPDSAIIMLDATTFEITWPSAIYIDADSYTISSL